jgi:hypothetical protein
MILTPDNEYTVLLDACVLAPMPLCETLLRLAEEPALYRPLWSDSILQAVGKASERMKYNSEKAFPILLRCLLQLYVLLPQPSPVPRQYPLCETFQNQPVHLTMSDHCFDLLM